MFRSVMHTLECCKVKYVVQSGPTDVTLFFSMCMNHTNKRLPTVALNDVIAFMKRPCAASSGPLQFADRAARGRQRRSVRGARGSCSCPVCLLRCRVCVLLRTPGIAQGLSSILNPRQMSDGFCGHQRKTHDIYGGLQQRRTGISS